MMSAVRRLISTAEDAVTSGEDARTERETGTDPETGDDYNYRRFRFWPADQGIDRGVTSGTEAPDATVYTLEGNPVELSGLWEDRPIVIEFGSITCPIFAAKVDAMDALAQTYDGIDFYIVYTREAHPG
ncbi:MAG: hypothetical protein M8354_04285, partial [Halalkalicoccus sp.]|nr:hypothetical protein [Halalkalicoccus sp.]